MPSPVTPPAPIPGLSEAEATARLMSTGYNELPHPSRRSLLALGVDIVREPMVLLLLASGAIYLGLGDLGEALLLLASTVGIIAITLYQERKTERALAALRELASPTALVIRDGHQRRIPGREVVPGDVVVLSEGDRVPADAVLLSALNLQVDESALTGESISVHKAVWDGLMPFTRPGGDDLPFVYGGTLVTSGHGLGEVRATGAHAEIGAIGAALETLAPEVTRLQRDTARVVRAVASAAFALCLLVAVLYGLSQGDWLRGLLAGITLAMALIPEEFPVVLTIFLALGAWRLSRRRVLARRTAAIEMLGAATVLCVDKTGTLTLNHLSVARAWAAGHIWDLSRPLQNSPPAALRDLVRCAVLASKPAAADPLERALHELGDQLLTDADRPIGWVLVREYPLSPELLAVSQVWRRPGADRVLVAAKGAPEAIAELCRLGPAERASLLAEVGWMANDGLRVLGVAHALVDEASLPSHQSGFVLELLGLVGLADPLRPTVPEAIRECHAAGIRVVMVTGDYPATARAIARAAGLEPGDVLSGPELAALDDDELRRRVRTTNVFARVMPEQKLRLINTLKANGEVVAMTGDGVNDAPALKTAQIGIAMGGRGTDVAREAAALVLLDDDFSSIVAAIRLGRRIFDNLKKAMAFLLAVHVPIAGMSLLPVVFGWPLALLPAHIVFLELIIDPVSGIVFEAEPEAPDVMRRPPRRPTESLFSRGGVLLSLIWGAGALGGTLAVYALALAGGRSEGEARALAFVTLVVADLGLVFAVRAWPRSILAGLGERNVALWLVVGATLMTLGLALAVALLRPLFHFGALGPADLALGVLVGVASIAWLEAARLARGRLAA